MSILVVLFIYFMVPHYGPGERLPSEEENNKPSISLKGILRHFLHRPKEPERPVEITVPLYSKVEYQLGQMVGTGDVIAYNADRREVLVARVLKNGKNITRTYRIYEIGRYVPIDALKVIEPPKEDTIVLPPHSFEQDDEVQIPDWNTVQIFKVHKVHGGYIEVSEATESSTILVPGHWARKYQNPRRP